MGIIRLACLLCDRNDGDGLERVPSDWMDVDEIQSYEEAIEDAGDSDRVLNWWTHIGVCPDCQEARYRPADDSFLEA